ncbi:tetratricopeptide repeat protein [Nitrosococcus watsonii]|uniref:Tetratricopeptide repeat protein n=1 Tax=Nitrosococcus watsoni (strain C-113) TaxID=105559 RepID=D8K4D5_NITWC|nr:hypothetical protein [Nitrosococcus watsonii]ADJ27832.1 Tetratricopeptide repeat protein [Nitrosococcus watsonii C-113]
MQSPLADRQTPPGNAMASTSAKFWGVGLLVLVWSMSLWAGQPYIPADDATVVERLPVGQLLEGKKLAALRTRLAVRPNDIRVALKLTRSYIQLGRAESDPRYYGYAQAALTPWWEQSNPPVRVQLLRGIIRQALHNFEPALEDLEAVLTRQPRNTQAWLSRSVVLLVQGRPRQALASCLKLMRLVDLLTVAACSAAASGQLGRGEAAYDLLERALSRPGDDPTTRQWALTVQGELARTLGQEDAAEMAFQQALALGVRDTYLLGAYADLLLNQDRPSEVLNLLNGETQADGLLLRLALAEARLDHPYLSRHLGLIEDRMAAARRRGDTLHLREAARATLHLFNNPQRALELALKNWQNQREPRDAHLVLEAALAASRPEAATPVLDWLDETGLQDHTLAPLQQRLREMSDHGKS